MPKGNGTTVDIHVIKAETQFAAHGEELGGKGFVGFDLIEIGHCPTSLFQSLAGGGVGPRPITSGSTPALAQPTMQARGERPRSAASSASMSTRAAAPSFTPEALPAVTTPSFLKAGRNLPSTSMVVPGRGNSSRAKSKDFFFCSTCTGTISSSNTPASSAAAALCWESTGMGV